ncbi:hypothetical protein KJ359_009381 [Pestalotiopsis sp. 9143b]|nr:hypothetical protein KJ359_009381 [Pestalotiopsis sp. 9143b]
MDPATIIQIIGTALSLGEVVVKSITKLSSIKARYQGAPMVDKTMIGQLYIVQSALDQLGVLSRPELSQNESVETLRLAKDCSSSIAGIDDSSIGSNSENSDLISVRFDFDKIILQSRIYQEVQRSRLRQSIRPGNVGSPA